MCEAGALREFELFHMYAIWSAATHEQTDCGQLRCWQFGKPVERKMVSCDPLARARFG